MGNQQKNQIKLKKLIKYQKQNQDKAQKIAMTVGGY
jgi:hypothetical protein